MADFRSYMADSGAGSLLLNESRPYINLDNAASTPPFLAVLAAVNDFMPLYASVHRGTGFKSRLSTHLYEEARQIVGAFVGADPAQHEVIFGKNTTEALNKLSYRLRLYKRDVVLISHLEHHSNDLPWRYQATVRRIGVDAGGRIDKNSFRDLLDKYKGRVKIVSISGASNVTGHLPDIYWFAQQAHQAGARIVIDAAQLAAHRPIRMGRLDDPKHLDYVAISGHKMYAPFGSGALIGRRDTFMKGEPEYRGGGTVELVSTKQVDWALPPDSEEAGSPNVVGAIAMARAVRVLQRIGIDTIARHESSLTNYALRKIQAIPGITLYGETEHALAAPRSGVIPFAVDGVPHHLVAAILGYEWNIGVRSGCFCAQPYVLKLLGIGPEAQRRMRHDVLHHRRDRLPGLVRISFGIYNTIHDIDILAEALQSIVNGHYGAYTLDPTTGAYTPVGLQENPADFFTL